MIRKSYAGVGSRRTPTAICSVMTKVASHLERAGWHLLSGGARGADNSFEFGITDQRNVTSIRPFFFGKAGVMSYSEALTIARAAYPIPGNTRGFVKQLFARNVMQVLDVDGQSPVKFVICWTPDAAITRAQCSQTTGGTRYAIAVADMHGIPVFNLARADHMERVKRMLDPRFV